MRNKIIHAAVLCLTCFSGGSALTYAAPEQSAELVQRGGFYALYAENKRQGIPNYITEDFLLQAYSMVRARDLMSYEQEVLLPALEKTLNALSELVHGGYDNTVSESSRQYIGLLQALVSGKSMHAATDSTRRELDLVRQASALTKSPMWGYTIDYSQFAPRGNYRGDAELKRYFIASRYASAVLFPVVASAATGVDAEQAENFATQALELSMLLGHPSVSPFYTALTGHLDWQFGQPDDLDADDLLKLARLGDVSAAEMVSYAESTDKTPKIIASIVNVKSLEAGMTAQQALTGWRLLPSRRSVDAVAMQQLVFDDTDALQWPCADCAQPPLSSITPEGWAKSYPSYLEVMSALGSAAAKAHIDQWKLHKYKGYEERAEAAKQALLQTEGVASKQLPVMQAVFASNASGHGLQSAAGFWVWQRYIGMLYQKQSTTPVSKGVASVGEEREGAVLAQNTALYQALLDLVQAHLQLGESELWETLAELLDRCVSISAGLDVGRKISADDARFLNQLDVQLAGLTGRYDLPIVTDLHTNRRYRLELSNEFYTYL